MQENRARRAQVVQSQLLSQAGVGSPAQQQRSSGFGGFPLLANVFGFWGDFL